MSFKNLTAAFVRAAEGQGQSSSPGIVTSASSFTCRFSPPCSDQSSQTCGGLRNEDVEKIVWSFLLSAAEGKAVD